MPHRGKRVFNIDPPASSNAIMRRARAPTAGENSEPGRHITQSLTSDPRVREPSANLGRFEGREGGSATHRKPGFKTEMSASALITSALQA
jgi:hypothetical protein